MKRLVSFEIAAEELGYSTTCGFSDQKSHLIKYVVGDKRKHKLFDIGKYKHDKIIEEELVEKSKLLIEYLYHIERVSYHAISKISNVGVTNIHSLRYGFTVAQKIVNAFAIYRPFHLKRFDEYYGWEHTRRHRRINLK